MNLRKYISIWTRLAQMAFMMQVANRLASLGWLGGKCVRLIFFVIFIAAIFQHVPQVGGYSLTEIAFFFLTFNIVDILSQLFFRGIYMIGRDIREGDMDFYLIQPVNPLFRIASNLVDFLDFLTLIPVLIALAYILPHTLAGLTVTQSLTRVGLYLLLCANGVIIAFSVHVAIASLTVRTQQMENTIWLYRDLMSLGRFPTDVYPKTIQYVLTLALPIAVMVTIPTKALIGLLTVKTTIAACAISALWLYGSIRMWKSALKYYCSVSVNFPPHCFPPEEGE